MKANDSLSVSNRTGRALHDGDFLLTWERTADELKSTLHLAATLEDLYRKNVSLRVFESGLAVSNFRDQSTRTRFSFASAANMLGLTVQELDEGKSQIAHGETVRETANMISFAAEIIGIRDDIFLGEGHKYMAEVAAAVDEGHRAGVLPQRPAVINLQCDLDHPTQSMADLLHLADVFAPAGAPSRHVKADSLAAQTRAVEAGLAALRGRKLAMTWAYSPSYGKPLSVPQGIITLMTRFGMHVTLAHPPGYDLVPETLEIAARHAAQSGGSFTRSNSMQDAFCDADIVYPKSWAPYRVMEERTRLLRGGQSDKLKDLERDALANNAKHKNWECTEELMALTGPGPGQSGGRHAGCNSQVGTACHAHDGTPRGHVAGQGHSPASASTPSKGNALYMHCLPADITGVSCKEGEVAAAVFERHRHATYREAGHKPFVIAAMMLMTRFEHPAAVIDQLVGKNARRRMA